MDKLKMQTANKADENYRKLAELFPNARVRNERLHLDSYTSDLGSRHVLARATELFWYPSEVDVSIRPGWFYHDYEDNTVDFVRQGHRYRQDIPIRLIP